MHAYLLTTSNSDKGSDFVSLIMKEVADIQGITRGLAITRHVQTTGMLEGMHALLKNAMKIETSERRSKWHKNVNIPVLKYNTTYHMNYGCNPFPYNVLDLKKGICPQKTHIPISLIAQDVFEQTEMVFQDSRKAAMQSITTTKLSLTKTQMPQNWNNETMCMSYNQTQIIK